MPSKRPSVNELERDHRRLCCARAFPQSRDEWHRARQQLRHFGARVEILPRADRERLWDSGIAATALYYRFSFAVAEWLARRAPGEVSIDWDEITDTARLDELLRQILHAAEDEYFDSGWVTSREWIQAAATGASLTDFDWLLAQLRDRRRRRFWNELYDAADLPLVWDLRGSKFSRTNNVLPVGAVCTREAGMRRPGTYPKREIQEPVDSIRRLSPRDGARLIDVAMASLAARHRETYHFNYANPKEVYLADVGAGVTVAVFGLLPEHRFPLECTMGYLILSNGVPIGYGGSSVLFRQVNTGINVFDEYRGSEAAFLWVQVMRVYHALVGCTRFIANPYQFGSDNDEALRSGAFWFYYRLGYRPVSADVRKLAAREATRMRRDHNYRSSLPTLRDLASCDLHLTLPGARRGDLFEERWIETSAMLATAALNAAGGATREVAADRVAQRVARDLRLRSLTRWTSAERRAFHSIAPIVAAADPGSWPADSKRAMRRLLRSKGGDSEAEYARLLNRHDKFLNSLKKACRVADAE